MKSPVISPKADAKGTRSRPSNEELQTDLVTKIAFYALMGAVAVGLLYFIVLLFV